MFQHLTISQKLFAGLGALVVATLLGAAYSLIVMRGLTSVFSTATQVHEFESVAEAASNMLGLERAMVLHSIFDQKTEVERYKQEFQKASQDLDSILQKLSNVSLSAEGTAALRSLSDERTAWKGRHSQLLEFVTAQKIDLATNILKDQIAPAEEKMQTTADVRSQSQALSIEAGGKSAGVKSALSAGLMIGLCLGIGGAVLFQIRGITSKLQSVSEALSENAEQMAASAQSVCAASQSTAADASKQAAALEQTSASTEEITSMTRKNAENSRSVANYMSETERLVNGANENSRQMTASMQHISASSEKVSKIIRVIDEIAFQTNILALNAAVEAARAGEAGMGFAVVADEVRNLAQRSAQAAKDTTTLIEESLLRSKEGSQQLEHVSVAVQSITESAGKVKLLVDEVSQGSQEQARGMDQIAKAVAEMDRVTQASAANAEESASAGAEMTAQAQALRSLVISLRQMVHGDTASHEDVRQLERV